MILTLLIILIPLIPLVPAPHFENDEKYKYRQDQDPHYAMRTAIDSYDHSAKITDTPFHVLVVYGNMYCSGSLVASRVVITAASCFHRHGTEDVFAKVGSDSLVGSGQLIKAIKVKLHEFYKKLSETDNDIAMLILEINVIFGPRVKKVVLVQPGRAMYVGDDLEISGFGSTNLPVKYVNKLVKTEMSVLNRVQCRNNYGGLITPSNYCVGYSLDRRLSDNGGPATHKGVMVGLVSFGANHKEPPFAAVITNVSYFHKWIKVNIQRYMSLYFVEHRSSNVGGNDYYNDLAPAV